MKLADELVKVIAEQVELTIKSYIDNYELYRNDVKRFLELYNNTNECNEITYTYAITQMLPDETPKQAMKRLDHEYQTLRTKLENNV